MTRWSWAVLVFELLLITIILILPQVDIPDTAFHCGTAPVLAKARLTSQPPQTQAGPDLRPVLQSKVNRVFSPRTSVKSTCGKIRIIVMSSSSKTSTAQDQRVMVAPNPNGQI